MDTNDDEMTDRLDFLADMHEDLFSWIDEQMIESWEDEDWHLDLLEPSDEELEMMNRAAEEFLRDMENKND